MNFEHDKQVMEHSYDGKFKKHTGSEKEKLKKSHTKSNIKNDVLHGSDKFKNSPKRSSKPLHKKSTQNNTINTWLTKDIEEKNIGKSEKKKLPQISNDIADVRLNQTHTSVSKTQKRTRDNSQSGSSIEDTQRKFSSPKRVQNPTEQQKKNKKKYQQGNSREHVQCKEAVNSISKKSKDSKDKNSSSSVKNIPCSLKERPNTSSSDLTTMENAVRKKFKRILTPPLSPTRTLSKYYKTNGSPQSNTISKWLNKHNFSSSSDESTKEKLKKRKVMDNNNYEPLEKENSSSASNQKKFKCSETETKRTSSEYSEKCKRSAVHSVNNKTKSKRNDDAIKPIKKANPVVGEKSLIDIRKLAVPSHSSTSNKSNMWLSKDVERPSKGNGNQSLSRSTKQRGESHEKRKDKTYKKQKLDSRTVSDSSEKSDVTSRKRNKTKRTPEQTLDNYICKSLKEKLKHSSPTNSNSSLVKTDKKSKSGRSSDSFKKYGVTVPSVEEILKEQKDFAKYKNQIESYGEINEEVFELSFSVKDVKDNETVDDKNVLGCKHLSIDSIEKAFYKNFDYISDIFHGRKYSERHEMFFNDEMKNNNQLKYSVKDLRCSTSTIVFSYEQKEHILTLLRKEFDPDDKHTLYFFHVLLPEFCLKIFMDTHNMTYDEAVQYLDTRPIVNE